VPVRRRTWTWMVAGWLGAFAPTAACAATPANSLDSWKSFTPQTPPAVAPASNDPRDIEGMYMVVPVDQLIHPITGGVSFKGTIIPPFSAAGAKLFWYRIAAHNQGVVVPDPNSLCDPSWRIRLNSRAQVLQTPRLIVFWYEENHDARLIQMNDRHPTKLKPSYLGDSVGHWQGNTLVVDTIGFNGKDWLDFAGSPESAKAHLVERITKGPGGWITDITTVDDPVMYTHPFSYAEHWFYQPVDGDFDEEVCENNRDTSGIGPLVPPP